MQATRRLIGLELDGEMSAWRGGQIYRGLPCPCFVALARPHLQCHMGTEPPCVSASRHAAFCPRCRKLFLGADVDGRGEDLGTCDAGRYFEEPCVVDSSTTPLHRCVPCCCTFNTTTAELIYRALDCIRQLQRQAQPANKGLFVAAALHNAACEPGKHQLLSL